MAISIYQLCGLVKRVHGNALDEEILDEVGFVDRTAFVASTGNDENNIISCLLAEKLGAPKRND